MSRQKRRRPTKDRRPSDEDEIAKVAGGDIPKQYVQVVGIEARGDQATAWSLTNGPHEFEPYEERLFKVDGRWVIGSGSGGFSVETPEHVLETARRLGWS